MSWSKNAFWNLLTYQFSTKLILRQYFSSCGRLQESWVINRNRTYSFWNQGTPTPESFNIFISFTFASCQWLILVWTRRSQSWLSVKGPVVSFYRHNIITSNVAIVQYDSLLHVLFIHYNTIYVETCWDRAVSK